MQFILGLFIGTAMGIMIVNLCRFMACTRPDNDEWRSPPHMKNNLADWGGKM